MTDIFLNIIPIKYDEKDCETMGLDELINDIGETIKSELRETVKDKPIKCTVKLDYISITNSNSYDFSESRE